MCRSTKYAPADRAEELLFDPRLRKCRLYLPAILAPQKAARRRPARMHAALCPEQ
jgi:hypothetical protein